MVSFWSLCFPFMQDTEDSDDEENESSDGAYYSSDYFYHGTDIYAACQRKVPIIYHHGKPLKNWHRHLRPPVHGKHLTEPYVNYRSSSESQSKHHSKHHRSKRHHSKRHRSKRHRSKHHHSKHHTKQHRSKRYHSKHHSNHDDKSQGGEGSRDPPKRTPKLYLYSHTPTQLSKIIHELVKQSEAQDQAVQRYRELRSTYGRDPEDPKLLLQYLELFDQIFFMGTLKDLCLMRVSKYNPQVNRLGVCDVHFVDDFPKMKLRYEALIEIDDVRGFPQYAQDPEERLHNMLGVLLHECVHAFLGLYSCVYHDRCDDHYFKVVSKSGHLGPWQEIAHAVEVRSRGLFERPLDLFRFHNLCVTIVEDDRKIPRESKLNRWSFAHWMVTQRLETLKITGGGA